MLKFHHAHLSRSGRVHWLLHELDVPFELIRAATARAGATRRTRTRMARCRRWNMTAS